MLLQLVLRVLDLLLLVVSASPFAFLPVCAVAGAATPGRAAVAGASDLR